MAKPASRKKIPPEGSDQGSSDAVFDSGLFGTPGNTRRSMEHDPDSFSQFDAEVSDDPELDTLFASDLPDTAVPSANEPDDVLDDLEALLGRAIDDDTPEDAARIVTSVDIPLPDDPPALADSDAPDEDAEPLGDDFDALFAAPVPDPVAPTKAAEDIGQEAPAEPVQTTTAPAPQKKPRADTVRETRSNAQAKPRSQSTAPRRNELDRAISPTTRPKRRRWRGLILWAIILGALGYVAFLPYSFDVGGEFTVESGTISQVRARTDGEVIKVEVNQGDWVKQDQVMAVLSNWDEEREIALREAEIIRRQAELQNLLDGAKPEEIALKRQELASAELKVQFAQSVFDRVQALFEKEAIAQKQVDERRDLLLLAQSERDEAKLALDLISSGARSSDIAAAEAEIARHQKELEYAKLRLEQTFVRAVTDGQIVSDLSDVPVGAYLPEGGMFAELADNRLVYAKIEVPETDIEEVQKGAEVEFRLWSDAETQLTGTVFRVAPRALKREFGKVIRVTVEIPNPDGRLSAGMTGYAKVAAEERPVWQAFSRMIVRFFQIELWSWLP
ncbi:MAG: efflux RND transporter periplasmic adaptor subunit [Roseovarius sp.]